MSLKRINVKGGTIALSVPEDVPQLTEMMNKVIDIWKKAAPEITETNKVEINRKCAVASAVEFENFFGKGSCKRVFGADIVSAEAYAEFSEKISVLVRKWCETVD